LGKGKFDPVLNIAPPWRHPVPN